MQTTNAEKLTHLKQHGCKFRSRKDKFGNVYEMDCTSDIFPLVQKHSRFHKEPITIGSVDTMHTTANILVISMCEVGASGSLHIDLSEIEIIK